LDCVIQELQGLKKGLDSEVEQLKSVCPLSDDFFMVLSLGAAHHPVVLLIGNEGDEVCNPGREGQSTCTNYKFRGG
jgi:hypothetical protein